MASIAQLSAAEGLPSSVHTEVAILGAMLLDGVAISDATAKLRADWWTLYDDRILNDLVTTALSENLDVAAAVAKIEEFDADLREANAALFPEIDLGAAAARTRSSRAWWRGRSRTQGGPRADHSRPFLPRSREQSSPVSARRCSTTPGRSNRP